MSESIYKPPEADIAVTTSDEAEYYVVAPRKFYLLSIFTINLYFVYWFYRNWRGIKLRTGRDMWPPMRGIFYIFFTHSLFADVDENIKSSGRSYSWNLSSLATLFVLVTIASAVLDRLSAKSVGSPITDLISLALVPVMPVFLLKAQHAINFACDDPSGSTNSRMTIANWLWMALGAVFWLMGLAGLYLVFFQPELLAE